MIDGVDYWMDAASVTLDSTPCDDMFVTYEMDLSEKFLWFFEIEGIQSTATSSLWRFLLGAVGQLVTFRYAVHGNATPRPDQPHLVGRARVMHPPRIGGAASRRGSQSFDMRLEVASPTSPLGAPVAPVLEEA